MIDRNSRHPHVHTRLQRIAFGIEPQNRRMLCDSVSEQDHINVVVEQLFLLTRWFLPFQFKQQSADTVERQALIRSRIPKIHNRRSGRKEARESVRGRDILDVVEKSAVAFQAMFDTKIQYAISPEMSGETEILAVVCPLVSQETSDSEQALEAAAIDMESAPELVRLATAAAFGKWRDDQSVMLTKTRQVTVQSTRDVPAVNVIVATDRYTLKKRSVYVASVNLMQPLTAGNPYLRKYEIFLCHFLDHRHWDDCRSNASGGERYAGAQPHISGRALRRFGFYANGRGESTARSELQRHDFR
jgi:hypothetical protein